MKRFLLVALLLVSAASVYAADLKITGDAEVRGVIDNADNGTVVSNNKYFDCDFNFNAALVVTENTTVFTKLTLDTEGATQDVDNGQAQVPDSYALGGAVLSVERAYVVTKPLPGFTASLGLMGGGTWASAFGNTEVNVVRLRGDYALNEDMSFAAIYEKDTESTSALGASNSDRFDDTKYIAAAKIKVAGISILPLVSYKQMNGTAVAKGAPNKKPTSMTFDLGLNGDFGMVGFEAEAIYLKVDEDSVASLKQTSYGAYVDVFAKIEPAKIGIAAIYCSSDATDGNFTVGGDFDFTVVADDLYLGKYATAPYFTEAGIAGMMGGKVYADAKVIEQLSVGAAFAYAVSTDKDVTKASMMGGKDVKFWEIDANVNYAIDANTSYIIEGGYAKMDVDTASNKAYRIDHKVAVKF